MRDSLVYFIFWMFITLSLRLGDVFGFILTLVGLYVMMYFMNLVKENDESLPVKLP